MQFDNIVIRDIRKEDNEALAVIIRTTLKEFGAHRPGTVYYDPTTDHLWELFKETPHSYYFVAEKEGTLLGGGGIFPSPGLPAGTCELVKMYLLPQARGVGLGRTLIQKCIDKALEYGFKKMYIETMPELKQAIKTYEKFGFSFLNGPLGNTGHFGCDIHMILDMEQNRNANSLP